MDEIMMNWAKKVHKNTRRNRPKAQEEQPHRGGMCIERYSLGKESSVGAAYM